MRQAQPSSDGVVEPTLLMKGFVWCQDRSMKASGLQELVQELVQDPKVAEVPAKRFSHSQLLIQGARWRSRMQAKSLYTFDRIAKLL